MWKKIINYCGIIKLIKQLDNHYLFWIKIFILTLKYISKFCFLIEDKAQSRNIQWKILGVFLWYLYVNMYGSFAQIKKYKYY